MVDIFIMSRLAWLDVKWTGLHKGSSKFHHWGHFNPNYEWIMVIDGPLFLQVEEERLVLQSGECMLLTPWQLHKGWGRSEESASFYWVQFAVNPAPVHRKVSGNLKQSLLTFQWRHQDLRTAEDFDDEPILIPRRYQPERRFEILTLLEKLVQEMKQPQGNFRFRATILLLQMIQAVADDLIRINQLDTPLPATLLTYRKLVNYLDEHYTLTITREMLEHQFQRKYEYLCQLFKRYSGSTVVTYTQQLRIQRAKYLLRCDPEATIESIAREVGFQDAFYFSKVFKRIAGMGPSQFRKTFDSMERTGLP